MSTWRELKAFKRLGLELELDKLEALSKINQVKLVKINVLPYT